MLDWDLVDKVEKLLLTANITPELDQRIRAFLFLWDYEKLARCADYLKANQIEPANPAKQNVARWRLHTHGL